MLGCPYADVGGPRGLATVKAVVTSLEEKAALARS
jgi:hypothetical protein